MDTNLLTLLLFAAAFVYLITARPTV